MNDTVERIRRPDQRLLIYYALFSSLFVVFFPIAFAVLYFRYKTLQYVFDDEGLTMSWGVLFRREISLNYARIQDIHLVSNVVERHLELGRVQIQTAAGSAVAEITIEGLTDFEEVRNLLYARMRGQAPAAVAAPPTASAEASTASGGETALSGETVVGSETAGGGETAAALREAAAELRALREALERRNAREQEG